MSDSATMEFSAETKTIGDQIAGLTLKQAKELSDYLKAQYGIEPAAGGAVVMAAPGGGAGGGAAAAAEKTEFDVVLANAGDKKLEVVKVVKNITGASLMDAKKMVRRVGRRSQEAQGGSGSRRCDRGIEVTTRYIDLSLTARVRAARGRFGTRMLILGRSMGAAQTGCLCLWIGLRAYLDPAARRAGVGRPVRPGECSSVG